MLPSEERSVVGAATELGAMGEPGSLPPQDKLMSPATKMVETRVMSLVDMPGTAPSSC
jgi:hypothetical protein